MPGMMLIGIFLKAFILMALLYFLARDEADYDFPKVAMVSAGILLVDSLCGALLQPQLGPLVYIPLVGGTLWLIKTFCWLTWKKASLVTLVFFAISVGFKVGAVLVLNSMVANGGRSQQAVHEEQLKEAVTFATQMWAQAHVAPASVPEPPSMPSTTAKKAAQAAGPVPVAAAVATTPLTGAAWSQAYARLKMGGSMSAPNATIVMINNRLYGDNERVSITYGGKQYTWRIKILGAQAVLEPINIADAPPPGR